MRHQNNTEMENKMTFTQENDFDFSYIGDKIFQCFYEDAYGDKTRVLNYRWSYKNYRNFYACDKPTVEDWGKLVRANYSLTLECDTKPTYKLIDSSTGKEKKVEKFWLDSEVAECFVTKKEMMDYINKKNNELDGEGIWISPTEKLKKHK